MGKILILLAIFCVLSVSTNTMAQSTDTATAVSTAPTEVGTTTMPAGQYTVIDQTSGKKYSLMVTTKGTMILGSAPIATASAAVAPGADAASAASSKSGLTGLAERQLQKGATTLIEKQGMSEIKSFIK